MTGINRPPSRRAKIRCRGLFLGMILLAAATAQGDPFEPGKAGFTIRFKNLVSSYSPMSVFVLPRENITLDIANVDRTGSYRFEPDNGTIIESSLYKWTWRAPDHTGMCTAKIYRSQPDDSITLHLFVLVPYDRLTGEYLNGYRIGRYPRIPYKGLPVYKPPRGFIEITAENADTRLSPHFTLGQFVCKQKSDYPRYVVVREVLLLKLELILQKVNEAGYPAGTFAIMSGYRTPYYNELIGNVKYSRHQWGGAADIFLDESPNDGMMDDLNKDGRINWRDAAIIYDIIDEMYGRREYEPFVGGLARYKKTTDHGPFVHVDVRGFRARWGY